MLGTVSVRALTFVALAALYACRGAGGHHPEPDGGAPDAGDDAGFDGDPGTRPVLEQPGQVVPLLYGRTVVVSDTRDASGPRDAYVPLDDPSHDDHRALFADLTAACANDLAATLTPPGGALAIPGCGRPGVFDALLAQCRADAAKAFATSDTGPGIAERDGRPRLELAGAAGARRWTMASTDNAVRASWALYAVAEERTAIAGLARLFDQGACPSDLTESALAEGDTLGQVAARALAQVQDSHGGTAQLADALLTARLRELAGSGSLDDSQRARLRIGLNDSLLERMKLYGAMPYGAFATTVGETSGRFPLVPAAPDSSLLPALVLMRAISADVLDGARQARVGDALSAALFDALRAREPRMFGALGAGDWEQARSLLGLETATLEEAARYLSAQARATGAPIGREQSEGRTLAAGLAFPDAPAPSGYVVTLTEAAAALEDDEAEYGLRGVAHASDLAARAAERARSRADVGAVPELALVKPPKGRARVCHRRTSDDAHRLEVSLLDLSSTAVSQHALLRGEDEATCLERGRVAGLACAAATTPANAGPDQPAFVVAADSGAPVTLYVVGPDGESGERRIRAAFTLAPFQLPTGERCWEQPLDAAAPRALGRVWADGLDGALESELPVVEGRIDHPLSPGLPVPLTFGRSVPLVRDGVPTDAPLAPSFSTDTTAVERGLAEECELAPSLLPDAEVCDPRVFRGLQRQGCLADGLARLADGSGGAVGAIEVVPTEPGQRTSLALWAYEARRDEVVKLALALRDTACFDSAAGLEASLWSRIEPSLADLETRFAQVRGMLDQEASGAADTSPRALHASPLATARLVVAVPADAYEPAAGEASTLFEGVFARFPRVTAPAVTAEDARIESLLRRSGLHPLLPDLTVVDGDFDAARVEQAIGDGSLAARLRARLALLDPEKFAGAPTAPNAFLEWLGVGQTELRDAAARIVQLAEARGVALLPVAAEGGALARGLDTPVPAPQALHLHALTEGRASLSLDASPRAIAARGFFHTLSIVSEALEQRRDQASDWSGAERTARSRVIAQLRERVPGPPARLVQTRAADGALDLTLEVSLPAEADDAQVRTDYRVVWTDAGLRCALGLESGCDAAETDLDGSAAEVEALPQQVAGRQRVRLAGLRLPRPTGWSPALGRDEAHGRIYAIERSTGRVMAALTLSPDARGRASQAPAAAPEWAEELVRLLAYRAPGEGCAGCAPASVCETTRCEAEVCIREPVVDGFACGRGMCVAGACDRPGCGDGARSDGSGDVPFEACDDGNLVAGDGCSETCEVERQRLAPLVREAYPAGPAPAIAIDGLGHGLVVYRSDALELGIDDAPIEALPLDAFGSAAGAPLLIEPNAARGLRADPTVAGLRDGGFAVVYASADVEGAPGIAYRLIASDGSVSEARAVDAAGTVQLEARVASVDDGFVVAWVERSVGTARARVRIRRFTSQGEPYDAAFDAAPTANGGDQREPTLASSLGQFLVAWSESDAAGNPLGVRARRFQGHGGAVDGAPFTLGTGDAGQPSASVLGTGDYVVGCQQRVAAESADLAVVPVRRFGPPLSGVMTSVVGGASDESRPVVAGAAGESVALAYQEGGSGHLYAPGLDADSASLASLELAESDQRDVSMVRTSDSVWLTWSTRVEQARALYLLRVPFAAVSGE